MPDSCWSDSWSDTDSDTSDSRATDLDLSHTSSPEHSSSGYDSDVSAGSLGDPFYASSPREHCSGSVSDYFRGLFEDQFLQTDLSEDPFEAFDGGLSSMSDMSSDDESCSSESSESW